MTLKRASALRLAGDLLLAAGRISNRRWELAE